MGTLRDWFEVIFLGFLWAGLTLWLSTFRQAAGTTRRILGFRRVLSFSLVGLWFGLMLTFRWNALHPPLIFLTVASFLGGILAARWPVRLTA